MTFSWTLIDHRLKTKAYFNVNDQFTSNSRFVKSSSLPPSPNVIHTCPYCCHTTNTTTRCRRRQLHPMTATTTSLCCTELCARTPRHRTTTTTTRPFPTQPLLSIITHERATSESWRSSRDTNPPRGFSGTNTLRWTVPWTMTSTATTMSRPPRRQCRRLRRWQWQQRLLWCRRNSGPSKWPRSLPYLTPSMDRTTRTTRLHTRHSGVEVSYVFYLNFTSTPIALRFCCVAVRPHVTALAFSFCRGAAVTLFSPKFSETVSFTRFETKAAEEGGSSLYCCQNL